MENHIQEVCNRTWGRDLWFPGLCCHTNASTIHDQDNVWSTERKQVTNNSWLYAVHDV